MGNILERKKWSFQEVLETPTSDFKIIEKGPAITLPKTKLEEPKVSLQGVVRDAFVGPYLDVEKSYYSLPMSKQVKTFFGEVPRATFETFYNMGTNLIKLPFRVAQAIPGTKLKGKLPVTEKAVTTFTKEIWRKFLDLTGKGWWVDNVEDFEIPPSYYEKVKKLVVEENVDWKTASVVVGSEAILDMAIVGGLVEGWAKGKVAGKEKLMSDAEARNTLGVQKGASQKQIKTAYHSEAHLTHPDKIGGSQEVFNKVNDAYQTLTGRRPLTLRVADLLTKPIGKEAPITPRALLPEKVGVEPTAKVKPEIKIRTLPREFKKDASEKYFELGREMKKKGYDINIGGGISVNKEGLRDLLKTMKEVGYSAEATGIVYEGYGNTEDLILGTYGENYIVMGLDDGRIRHHSTFIPENEILGEVDLRNIKSLEDLKKKSLLLGEPLTPSEPPAKPSPMFEEGKDMTEITRPLFSRYPKGVKEALGTIQERFGVSGIRSLEKMGKYGQELSETFKEIETQASIKTGGMELEMEKVELGKLTEKEGWGFIAKQEQLTKIPIENEKIDKALDVWQKHNKIIADFAQGMNVFVRTNDGSLYTFSPRDNYFPHKIRISKLLDDKEYQKKVIDGQTAIGNFRNKTEAKEFLNSFSQYLKTNGKDMSFINKVAIKNKISPAEAEFRVRNYILPTNPRKFGSLERAREVNLPLYDTSPAQVLDDFYRNVWRRMYEIQNFGQNDELARRLITQIGQEGQDWQLAQRIFDVSTNKISFDKQMRKALGTLSDVQSVKLILAQVIQITQQSDIIAYSGWVNWVKGLGQAFTKAGRDKTMEAGAIFNKSLYEAVSGIEKHGFGETFLRKTGFTFMDNFNRITASNSAPYVVRDLIKNPNIPINKSRLKDLFIKKSRINALLERGYPTDEDLKIASFRLAKITQYTVRPEDLPPAWRDNLVVKTASMYKGFAFQKANFVYDYILKNPSRFLRWISSTAVFSEIAMTIRSFIRGKERKKGLYRLIEDFTALGTFGMLSDIIEASNYPGGLAKWSIGPVFGDAVDISTNAFTGKWGKGLDKILPYLMIPSMSPEMVTLLYSIYEPLKRRVFFPYK